MAAGPGITQNRIEAQSKMRSTRARELIEELILRRHISVDRTGSSHKHYVLEPWPGTGETEDEAE